jgi:hypothetical protein
VASLSFTVLLWNCSVLRHRSPFFYRRSSFLFSSGTHAGQVRSTACVFRLHDKEVVKNIKGVLPVGRNVVADWKSRPRFATRKGFRAVRALLLATGASHRNYCHSMNQIPRL